MTMSPPQLSSTEGSFKVEHLANTDKVEARPWSGRVSRMQVITPPKGAKQRVNVVKRQKSALEQILSRSPTIDLKWCGKEEGENITSALVDTGADWSLLHPSLLTAEERGALQDEGCGLEAKDVQGDDLYIMGEVWRDFQLGDLLVTDHRFVVVERMTSDVILGADLWGRVSPVQLDFGRECMTVCGGRVSLSMKCSHKPSSTEDVRQAKVKGDHIIPANMEALIKVRAKGMKSGQSYLFQPLKSEEDRVGSPYAVVESKDQLGHFWVKVTNLENKETIISDGTSMGTIDNNFELSTANINRVRVTSKFQGNVLEKTMVGKELTKSQRDELHGVLQEFQVVFYNEGKLPVVEIGVEHCIRGHESIPPIACRPRRLDPESETEVREELDKLLKMGVIRPSNSPWAAPVVCARRSDGSLRLAIDYRKVNEQTQPATLHPIPLIEDLLDRLSTAKFYSVLDAKSGYHQLPLRKQDSEVSAFVVPWGQFEWADRTPFGLKGAGYSFQRLMAMLLGSSNFVEALCYLDDILIWGENWEIHLHRLRSVLGKVLAAGLALSPEKCKFGVTEVVYLGSVIRNGMISISKQRVEDLQALPSPTTIKELRRVLGAFAFVQRWLPGVAEVARPLYDGVKGKPHSKLVWTKEMESAFVKLKSLVAEAVSLRIPDHTKKFTLITDCSDVGAGAVLTQEENGVLVPNAFFHHALTPAEQKYHTTDKELLAAVLAVRKFRVYLTRGFDLVTDHEAVKWLKKLNLNDEKGRRGRWVETLQQYDISLIHKPGRSPDLCMADYLSRIIKDGGKNILREDRVPIIEKPQGGKETDSSVNMIQKVTGVDQSGTTLLCEVGLDEIRRQQREDKAMAVVVEAFIKSHESNVKVELDKDVANEIVHSKAVERLYLDKWGILMMRFNGVEGHWHHPVGLKIGTELCFFAALHKKS